jgi:hypothetical protein
MAPVRKEKPVQPETPAKLIELRNELRAAKGLVRKKMKQIARFREENTAMRRRCSVTTTSRFLFS